MSAGAKTAPKQTYFDEAERDRIRRALLRYMEENRIGVPTLQRLVAEANDIVVDRVPLKTLQRFLGDTHRSNDAMVRFCEKFISGTPADDPLDRLGEQLAAFHAVPAPDGNETLRGTLLTLDLCAGTFESIGKVRPKGLALLSDDDGDQKTKVSDLTLVPRAASPFLRATEAVGNWRHEAAQQGNVRRAYDGVAVITAAGLMVTLRSVLTGAPRTWWLRAVPDGLAGPGAEPVSPLDRDPSTALDQAGHQYLTFRHVKGKHNG